MSLCPQRTDPLNFQRFAHSMRLLRCVLSVCGLALSAARGQDPATGAGYWEIVHHEPQSGFLWAVATGNQGAVAVGEHGRIVVSTDGRTWRAVASPVSEWLVDVVNAGTRFIAVGDRGTIITSTDLTTWTRVPQTATDQRLNAIRITSVVGALRYIAVGERGTIIVSDDGLDWRSVASGTTAWLRGIAGDGHFGFIVVGQGGVILASDDCLTWRAVPSPTTQDLEAVIQTSSFSATAKSAPIAYGWVDFTAVGAAGTEVLISYGYNQPYGDGAPPRTFTPGARLATGEGRLPTTVRFRGLVSVHQGKLLAFGEDGSAYSSAPFSGTWMRTDLGTRANIVSGAPSAAGTFLLGEESSILFQPNALASRLRNLSTRGFVGPGLQHLTAGVVVRGPSPKRLLVRAVGPALAQFGVPSPLPNPLLAVFSSDATAAPTRVTGIPAAQRSAVRDAAASAGAFALQDEGRDAATIVTLAPGGYTFRIESADGASGEALVEVYDLDPVSPQASALVNLSSRGTVSASRPFIAGFVLDGPTSTSFRRLLARAVGPGIQQFGVTSTVADPSLALYRAATVPYTVGLNDNWQQSLDPGRPNPGALIRAIELGVGAFALPEGSKDAALVSYLQPHAYTAVVSSPAASPAEALVEVYDVPF